MNPNHDLLPIRTACDIFGGQSALARRLGVSAVTVNQWLKHERPVPAARCVAIERATNGAVTRQELRPHDWAEIWPELSGQEEGAPHA
ncbi:helix-turn-helix domain-containing protein [Pigmentiphaga daeguensis]|uniref:Antitoxin of toxin-antitoxin system, YdaS/YdaT n=1 Tax=Pigmentiphaga daeguensis TaxID=414049 RepID=A0ABN1BAQ0_9BURK